MKLFALTTLSSIVFFFAACEKAPEVADDTASTAEPAPAAEAEPDLEVEVIDVEAAEAAALVADGTVSILDVRTPAEFASGHIEGAVLANIQGEGFEGKVAKLDQSKPYLVHCAAGVDGGRSRKAVEALANAGAIKVYHLNGGMNAWMQGEHPVATPEAKEKAETKQEKEAPAAE
ncbi:MAG: rhodanese-like domain-containing protein [Verrucomicrobiota bacterium]